MFWRFMAMSIAVMMLIHKDDEQINRLIKHLSNDFDVYVHIDKRSSVKIENTEKVFVYKEYKTYWGSFNQIMATLFLLRQSYQRIYDRYLLISGQDLPIKTNKEIIDFFEGNNNEYIDGDKMPVAGIAGNGGFDRMTKYWPNYFYRGNKNKLLEIIFKFELRIFEIISLFKPRAIDYEFYKGTNWINFTHKCVTRVFEYLEKDRKYINRFKWTNCADEIFYHTILNKLDGLEIINESLRYINWVDGPEYPKVLDKDDYMKIINSNKLFARKFDMDIDKEIIEMVYKKVACATLPC